MVWYGGPVVGDIIYSMFEEGQKYSIHRHVESILTNLYAYQHNDHIGSLAVNFLQSTWMMSVKLPMGRAPTLKDEKGLLSGPPHVQLDMELNIISFFLAL